MICSNCGNTTYFNKDKSIIREIYSCSKCGITVSVLNNDKAIDDMLKCIESNEKEEEHGTP